MGVTANGIYTMPAEEYHADPCPEPSLSASIAKVLLSRSAQHAWAQHPRLNPLFVPEERTAFDRGSAAHALLLEGENRMVQIDADSYRTKAAQEARDAARAAGKHPILAADYASIIDMRGIAMKAIERCPDLGGMTLADGKPEQTLIWKDGPIWCRARLDWLADDHSAIWDYKSTTDSEPSAFSRQIARMGYHIQSAFYRRGVQAITGKDAPFIFIAQECDDPYGVTFHGCAPSMQEIADAEVSRAIDAWAKCLRTGIWPGYERRIHWAEAQNWQMTEHEERLALGIPYDPALLWEKVA